MTETGDIAHDLYIRHLYRAQRLDPGEGNKKAIPLVMHEDEAEMLIAEPVRDLVVQGDRFHELRATGRVNGDSKALQFRGG